MVKKNVYFKYYFNSRFNEISVTSIRTYLYSYGFNLTNTVEALSNNHNVTILKNKRKTVIRPYQVNFKTTENVEFLKEVNIECLMQVNFNKNY